MFVGFGPESGTGAGLAFLPSADVGSTTSNVTTLTIIAGLSAEVVTDVAVLNDDLVMSLAADGGGQAWRCADYANTDCSDGGNWSKWGDFGDGTGLGSAAAGNTVVRWVRQMPTSGAVYLGTENSGGSQIWSAVDMMTNLAREPQNGCGGLGDSSLICLLCSRGATPFPSAMMGCFLPPSSVSAGRPSSIRRAACSFF